MVDVAGARVHFGGSAAACGFAGSSAKHRRFGGGTQALSVSRAAIPRSSLARKRTWRLLVNSTWAARPCGSGAGEEDRGPEAHECGERAIRRPISSRRKTRPGLPPCSPGRRGAGAEQAISPAVTLSPHELCDVELHVEKNGPERLRPCFA